MKTLLFCLFVLWCTATMTTQSHAAFVHYRDTAGKIHYINTDYAKVPDQYLSQVQDQLKKIEESKPKPVLAIPMSNVPVNIDPMPLITTTPITKENRLTRLTNAVDALQTNNLIPASVNINSGIINYVDNAQQNHPVTAETLGSVPEEFLPQIDAQIENLERLATQIAEQKTLWPGTSVEVFIKSNCVDCTRLKTLLDIHKIKHLTYDVETSNQGMAFYQEMKDKPLPITRIGSKIIQGTDINSIKMAISADDDQ